MEDPGLYGKTWPQTTKSIRVIDSNSYSFLSFPYSSIKEGKSSRKRIILPGLGDFFQAETFFNSKSI